MFPGQGSQRPGMGQAWRDHPAWQLVGLLSEVVGRDLAELLLDAGPETLRATRNAQLATYTLSTVALMASRQGPLDQLRDDQPMAVAGHSLGEYTALVAAGALDADQGIRLVHARGEAMQAAADANPGTMVAVLGLDMTEVSAACNESEGAWVATQCARPGGRGRDGARRGAGRTTGARARGQASDTAPGGGRLHSPLMGAAQDVLDAALARGGPGRSVRPVVTNVDAQPHTGEFSALLSAQLCSPVRWRESLLTLAAMGARLFVELGPGTELSGMVKRTLPEAARANVASPEDLAALAKVAQVFS